MNTKLTPGPWKYAQAVQDNGPNYFAVTDGKWGSPTIAMVFDEAHARAIAAVPELRETLKACMELVQLEDAHLANYGEFDRARALLAKIERT